MNLNIDNNRLIEIFFELVSINAISKHEKPVAQYIQKFLKKLHIDCSEDNAGKLVNGNSGNIIAKIDGKDSFSPIALASHMDTIKSTIGIKPLIKDNKLVSDGNTILGADNRAGIAIILYTIEELRNKNKINRPFEVIFTIGEETGLFGSSNLDMDLVESDTIYILDSSASPGYFVYTAAEAYDFEIKIFGKASHAAVNPEKGINAIKIASDLIQKYPIGKVDKNTTINFGKICGGEANNVVPYQIDISGEIRSFDKNTIDMYYKELDKCLKIISDIYKGKYRLTGAAAFPGFTIDLSCDAITKLNESFQKTNLLPKPIRYHGGSDANILNNRGFTAVNLGIGAKNPHSTAEYIKINDMNKMVQVISNLLVISN